MIQRLPIPSPLWLLSILSLVLSVFYYTAITSNRSRTSITGTPNPATRTTISTSTSTSNVVDIVDNWKMTNTNTRTSSNHSNSSNTHSISMLWVDVCTQETIRSMPFCNVTISMEERVTDYTNRIPIGNKIQMMGNTAASYGPLYIPSYQWWSEGLHGPEQPCITIPVNNVTVNTTTNTTAFLTKCPTSFPCPSGLGASFNNTLFYTIGTIIGREARAISNVRSSISRTDINNPTPEIGDGYTYWSPVINMQRDPRWGRNQEVPSEDPYLTSHYAVQYIHGLQQNQPQDTNTTASTRTITQIAGCCKHYVGNSLENWYNYSRHSFDAIISQNDLEEYYLVPFQSCIRNANVLGIMCSYNSINGIPSCANNNLLRDIVRTEWNFTGYITSDCGAIEDIYRYHKYVPDPVHAVAVSMNATTDMNCGSMYQLHLLDALEQQLVYEKDINASFDRLVTVQMKLGLFDNDKNTNTNTNTNPFAALGIHNIDTKEHQQVALEAAQQSIVLLQNKNNTILPIRLGTGTGTSASTTKTSTSSTGIQIAVLGPHYQAKEAFLSNYHGDRCSSSRTGTTMPNTNYYFSKDETSTYDCIETPLEAIQKANVGGSTIGTMGCTIEDTVRDDKEWESAIAMANSSDTIVLMMGLDQTQEREEHDRINTTLPGLQIQFITEIVQLNKSNTILVLLNGGSISLGSVLIDSIPAILDIYYGGQSASQALASILFGKYNPTGKLSSTMYPPEYVEQIPLTEMGLRVGVGRTHMYYTGKPDFSFGYGLSYSIWKLTWHDQHHHRDHHHSQQHEELSLSPLSLSGYGAFLTLYVKVHNMGPLPGSQTVLLFRLFSYHGNQNHDQQQQQQHQQQNSDEGRQKQKLIGYNGTRDILQPGESEIITFHIPVQNSLLVLPRNKRTSNNATILRSMLDNTTVTIQAVAADYVAITRSFRIVINGDDNYVTSTDSNYVSNDVL